MTFIVSKVDLSNIKYNHLVDVIPASQCDILVSNGEFSGNSQPAAICEDNRRYNAQKLRLIEVEKDVFNCSPEELDKLSRYNSWIYYYGKIENVLIVSLVAKLIQCEENNRPKIFFYKPKEIEKSLYLNEIDLPTRDTILSIFNIPNYHCRMIKLSSKLVHKKKFKSIQGLIAALALSGCGQLISCNEFKNSYVEIMLLFPEGVTRIKSKDELKRIRAIQRQIRIQKTKEEQNILKGRDKRKRISPSSEFKNFLLEEFGKEFLSRGSGIVDVAGGKGELSFKLLAYAEVESTIIDPRPYNVTGILKHVTKDHLLRISENECAGVLKLPNHLQCWFTYENHYHNDSSKSSISEVLNNETSEFYVQDKLVENETDLIRLKNLLQNCSIIIGLHPDQATEYIVDFAINNKVAFAVIPCCVFSNSILFRHRSHVNTYDKFISFLMSKSDKIKKTKLEFPGRNIVLYYHP